MKLILAFIATAIFDCTVMAQLCGVGFGPENNGGMYSVNGTPVTITYSAFGISPGISYSDCGLTSPLNSFWIGKGGTPRVGTLALNFSAPVNDVVVYYNAFNVYEEITENFTVTTNNGDPALSNSYTGCNLGPGLISGNTITATAMSSESSGEVNAGIISIHAPRAYTSLTLIHDEIGNAQEYSRENGTLLWFCFDNITLPIVLSDFYAITKKCNTELFWNTATELNSSYYEIEFSIDGIDFFQVGKLASHNIYTGSKYKFTHGNMNSTKGYYRLKLVDTDGSFKYSYIITTKNDCPPAIHINPNPVQDLLNIEGLNGDEFIWVYNFVGQKIEEIRALGNTLRLNTSTWNPGFHLIKIQKKNGEIRKVKILKI